MKKILVLIAAVSLVVACNNNKGPKKVDNRQKDDYSTSDDKTTNNDRQNDNTDNGDGWSQSDKTAFLDECQTGFSGDNQSLGKQICPCALEKFEKKFSSYAEAQRAGDAEGEKVGRECATELNVNNNTNNGSNNANQWSSAEESEFMNSCEGTAKPKVGAARANEYCDCMLQKLKSLFSSYTEASTKLTNTAAQQLANDCNAGH